MATTKSFRGKKKGWMSKKRVPFKRGRYQPAITRGPRMELKSVDTSNGFTNFAYAGGGAGVSVNVLNLLTPGTGDGQRIGRQCNLRSLEVRGHVEWVGVNTAAELQMCLRMLLIFDRQPNGAVPVWADIMNAVDPFALPLTANKERFVILRDRQIIAPPIGINGAASAFPGGYPGADRMEPQSWNYHEYVKLKGLETTFKGTTGTIADIMTGSILMILASGQQNSANPPWGFNYATRVRYYDA